jgi:hypothetical protein
MPGKLSRAAAKPVRFAMGGSLNRYKAELMRRDPIGREYCDMEASRKKYNPQRLSELKDALKAKYGTDPGVALWDWDQIESDIAAGRAPLADWVPFDDAAILCSWSGAGMPYEIIHEDGGKTVKPGLRRGGQRAAPCHV